jgi:glycosyltransferase involved in cell wall biosynthesis
MTPPIGGPRLFASLDPFLPPVPGRTLAGRGVANHHFLVALMRYGSFEGYHFFLPTPEDLRAFRATYGAVAPGGVPISSLPRRALIERLHRTDYSVFHLGDHVSAFQALCCLRNERASKPFPVTALTHSISDQANMSAYLAMGLQGPRPYDAIVCASPSGRDVLRHGFESLAQSTEGRIDPPLSFEMKLPVIPLGVDANALAGGDRERGRALAEVSLGRLVVLYVGRLSPHDKMDLFPLFRAFAQLCQRDEAEDPVLVLAGARQGSPYVDMLSMWAQGLGIRDRVFFLADFEEERKADIYAAADIFVSPCDNPQETFGLTVIEAMAAGLPVVVSDYDGYRETVPETAGIHVPTFAVDPSAELSDLAPVDHRRSVHLRLGQGVAVDLVALVDALSSLARDPARRRAMGQAGARHARRRYDWQRVIPQFENLWDDLSAEAEASTELRPTHPNVLRMDYARSFQHYPTRRLGEDDLLVRTDLGEAFLRSGRYPVYAEMVSVLDLGHVRRLVHEAAEPTAVRVLVDGLSATAVEVSRARQTVLWALKHGLLEMVPSVPR